MLLHQKIAWLASLAIMTVWPMQSLQADTLYRWVDSQGRVHFTDKPEKIPPEAEPLDIKAPPRQSDASQDQQQHKLNQQWFEQRRREREKAEAIERKQQKKQAKAKVKAQEACSKKQKKLAQAQQRLKNEKRAGITPARENTLKRSVEQYELQVEQEC